MNKMIMVLAFILFGSVAFAEDVQVKGYWRDTNRDGVKDTYVEPYHRTSPNNSLTDNYSSKGNQNPYTGTYGTKEPERTQPSTKSESLLYTPSKTRY
jgi:hypothetical protein